MTTGTRSAEEQAIRDEVVAQLRITFPNGRIIHELNVDGGNTRADVVCVTNDTLVLCEIKSEKDTLKRLLKQVSSFSPVAHYMAVVAHSKWITNSDHNDNDIRKVLKNSTVPYSLWEYPRQKTIPFIYREWWGFYKRQRPWTARMLNLLWVEELRDACRAANIKVAKTTTSERCVKRLTETLPAPAIEKLVCRALRQRTFAEADPAIPDLLEAAE